MDLSDLVECVIEGNATEAQELTRTALADGIDPGQILDQALIPAMDLVGERFGRREIYVPEMLLAARAMQTSVEVLDPLLSAREPETRGTVVIGTVKGDVHDIGKNIVCIMLRGVGLEVHDLGVDVTPEQFVRAVKEREPDIVGLSALITTTMPVMRTVIEALEAAGVREGVRVLIGGAPVTEEYAQEIKADGYGADAAAATERARELIAIH